MITGQEKGDCDERFKNSEFTGYFPGQANLDKDKVAGFYYDTLARVTFENLSINQAPEDETSLSNQIF